MSVFPIEEWPWWKALLRSRHLGTTEDIPPPPAGFGSWAEYATYLGVTPMDFLPLGPAGGVKSEGALLTLVYTRTGEDVATNSLHFIKRDGSNSAPMEDADLATVEGHALTLWGALAGMFSPNIALDRFEWHDFGVGVRKPNPKRKETLLTPVPGSGNPEVDELPPQVAISVTFKTSRRRSWGRVYLPNPSWDGVMIQEGRLIAATVNSIRTAFGNFMDACAGDNTPLVVWSPRHAAQPLQYFRADGSHPESAHALNLDEPDDTSIARTADTVQVDDLLDVQRRRRFDKALVKATHTIGA